MLFEEKKQNLSEYIANAARSDIALAFSGGVDSSLLLKLCCDEAKKNNTRVYAMTAMTSLHPMKDLEISRQVAMEMGAELIIVKIDELQEAGIADNPMDRCYRCKKSIFKKLKEKSEELNVDDLLEGTNEDDLHVYRPGIKALKELNIKSPLAMFGFTKAEVRAFAKELGVSVANRPSTPCMATRFPYGTRLSYDVMRKVEAGEEWIRAKGFYNVRLRVHADIVRIEVDLNEMEKFLSLREQIVEKLHELGFDYITLDLEGFRSGSMDLKVKKE